MPDRSARFGLQPRQPAVTNGQEASVGRGARHPRPLRVNNGRRGQGTPPTSVPPQETRGGPTSGSVGSPLVPPLAPTLTTALGARAGDDPRGADTGLDLSAAVKEAMRVDDQTAQRIMGCDRPHLVERMAGLLGGDPVSLSRYSDWLAPSKGTRNLRLGHAAAFVRATGCYTALQAVARAAGLEVTLPEVARAGEAALAAAAADQDLKDVLRTGLGATTNGGAGVVLSAGG